MIFFLNFEAGCDYFNIFRFRTLTKMLLLDIGIGCLFFAILVGGLSAFRDFALSLQFGSNLFCLGRLFCIRRVAFY